MQAPEDCQTMAELRQVIDALDRDLVRLLARRQACIDRAAELKQIEGLPAHIPARVAEVLDRVEAAARAEGLSPELARGLWMRMIDWAIAREERALAAARGDGA